MCRDKPDSTRSSTEQSATHGLLVHSRHLFHLAVTLDPRRKR